MSEDIDVTNKISFAEIDDEQLPIIKCVCGKEFERWDYVIYYNDKNCRKCPNCNRRFYFINKITVYEVVDE
jgi:hypothetical protein